MEFDFTSLAFGGEQHIACWDATKIRGLSIGDAELLTTILIAFGKKSAVAQGLNAPVTDIHRLRNTDQRLYLYMYRQSHKTVVLGGIKVGTKRLFIRTATSELKEIAPTCVLDFYVHESMQRQGIGKVLFEHFLATERVTPGALAYDRPSPKLQGFLRKHYGLTQFVPQNNSYVVFDQYWDLNPAPSSSGRVSLTPSRRQPVGGRASAPASPLVQPVGGSSWGGYGGPPASSSPGPSLSPYGPPPPGSASFGSRWAASNFGSGSGGAPPATPPPPPPQQQQAHYGAMPSADTGRLAGDSLDRHMGMGRPGPYGGTPPATGSSMGMAAGGQRPYTFRTPWAMDESPAGPSAHSAAGRPAPPAPQPPQQQHYGMRGPGPGPSPAGPGAPAPVPPPSQSYGGNGPHSSPPSTGPAPAPAPLGHQLSGLRLHHATPPPPQGPAGRASTPPMWAMNGRGSGGAGSTPGGGPAPDTPSARGMAAAQRSGAGAADCLVW